MSGILWSRWQKLMDSPAKQLATIIAVDSRVITVQLVGGGLMDIVSGRSYNIGQKVFVQGQQIVGEAPDLVYFEAEV